MANVLTQSEIDALLNSLTSGEDVQPEKEEQPSDQAVRLYDFRTANKFSKEQMRTLHTISDNFATVLSTRMTGMLRTLSEVTVISVEEQSFGEFNNSIPLPALIAVVNAQPLNGSMIFQMSSSVVYGIISCLFGGTADYTDESKPFSEIDLALMQNVIPQYLKILEDSWERVAKLRLKLDRIETSPQFTQIAAANEPSALITFNVKIDSIEDMMTICMPHFIIQPLSKQLNSTAWALGEQGLVKRERDLKLESQVLETKVSLRARLQSSRITMAELLRMKPGDILCTSHRIDDFVLVDVEKIPKFKAVLGKADEKRVVQIAKIIKEQENIERQ